MTLSLMINDDTLVKPADAGYACLLETAGPSFPPVSSSGASPLSRSAPMPNGNGTTAKLISGYLLSLLLIPFYVNMFPVWQALNNHVPSGVLSALPVVLTAAVLLALVWFFRLRDTAKIGSLSGNLVALGIGLCIMALLLPDPQFPAKRIHVVEYLLLSLVVRFAMAQRLQGLALLVCTACFTAILGIHDEFLQGLHPSRTYGLSDITVNTLSGCGGALIWHGCNLFSGPPVKDANHSSTACSKTLSYLAWLLVGVLALIVPAVWYRGGLLPFWPALPLIGAFVCFSFWENHFPLNWRHGLASLSSATLALCFYPLLTYVETLLFY